MGRPAQLHFTSLKNCLINLPLSIHGPLLERGIAPQSLVVELSYPSITNKKVLNKVYVGWTGMPSEVSGVSNQVRGGNATLDRVEIDPQFAQMLGNGLMEGMPVSIELLRDLPVATSVSVTPVSADDWEILESNAEFVETHLLNQVRAVKEGMVVGCWVGGTTLVRFIVDATTPNSSPALLLTSATELLVAPKSRNVVPSSTTKSHDLSSSSSVPIIPKSPAWEAQKRELIRLLPLEYELSFLKPPTSDSIPSTSTSSSKLIPTELELLTSLYVSPLHYKALKLALPSLRCTIAHFPRPTPNIPKTSEGKEKESNLINGNNGNSNGSNNGDKEDEKLELDSKIVEVRIREGSKEIKFGHGWLGESLRKELKIENKTGYEMINLLDPLTPAAKKAKLSNGNTKGVTSPPLTNGNSRSSLPRRSSATITTSSVPTTNGIKSTTSDQLTTTNSTTSTSIPTYIPMAGVEDKLNEVKSHVTNSLATRQLFSDGLAASGMLVIGASGAGKTSLVKQVARELSLDPKAMTHTVHVDCSKFTGERQTVMKTKIKDWFDEACWHAPSIIVFDNLDKLIAAEVEHADSFASLHLAHTFLGIASPALINYPIILMATAQSTSGLHPLLLTTHLLGETVSLKGPGKAARRDIIGSLVKVKVAQSNLLANTLDFASIAALTEGYLPADLRDLVDRAIHAAAMRAISDPTSSTKHLDLFLEDFNSAQIGFSPLSLRDIKLQKSEVQWADIGGLHETRKILRETLEWPTKYGAIFANCPLRLRSGLLLYGFPGCGKTLLASAVAKECGLNFISVKGPEILNKYIGASEKSVRDLFERASAAKPCILFFDEFDSIAPKRGHDSTGVTDRVVNQMLTQMDGAEGLEGVYVLAATSRPDLIDPALLRPGRLDKSLLCDMPNFKDRLEIMQACSRKIALAPEVDLEDYAKLTQGYSGADLQALIYNAHLDAIHATLTATTSDSSSGGEPVEKELVYKSFGGSASDKKVLSRAEQAVITKRLEIIMANLAEQNKVATVVTTTVARPVTQVENHHLQASLESTRPSVPLEELARLQRIYSEFVSGRSATGLPSGEASDEIGGRASLM